MRNLPNNSPGGREQGRGGTQRAQVARSETSLLSQPQVHEPDETPDPERQADQDLKDRLLKIVLKVILSPPLSVRMGSGRTWALGAAG